ADNSSFVICTSDAVELFRQGEPFSLFELCSINRICLLHLPFWDEIITIDLIEHLGLTPYSEGFGDHISHQLSILSGLFNCVLAKSNIEIPSGIMFFQIIQQIAKDGGWTIPCYLYRGDPLLQFLITDTSYDIWIIDKLKHLSE